VGVAVAVGEGEAEAVGVGVALSSTHDVMTTEPEGPTACAAPLLKNVTALASVAPNEALTKDDPPPPAAANAPVEWAPPPPE